MSRRASIAGVVGYREGDGPSITMPQGPCEVDETAQDATISWVEGPSHGSAAMPYTGFRRYLLSRAIRFDGAAAA